jgi:RimJ/RimL family protein N-acetyltransferase
VTAKQTARLVLREFTPGDVDLLADLDSDPEVMKYLTNGVASTRESLASQVSHVIAEYPRYPGFGMWSAFERDSGEFVGWFALQPHSAGSALEPELGYRLQRRVWGRGYATEGAVWLRDYAFGALGATRIWADTMAVNTRSRAVMERIGLRHIATYIGEWEDPIPGSEEGDVVYALTRDEWAALPR